MLVMSEIIDIENRDSVCDAAAMKLEYKYASMLRERNVVAHAVITACFRNGVRDCE